MVSLKQQLIDDLEILLQNKGHYNYTIDFVDDFTKGSTCTGLVAEHDVFPIMFHIHHNELINQFEVMLTWIQTPEQRDYRIDRIINSNDWFDKQLTKQILFQSILNVNLMAEIAMEDVIYN